MPPSGATSGGSSSNHTPHLPEDAQARFRTDIASPARTWNYWLGGKDNYEVDRIVGDATAALNPELIRQARQGRQFLSRAVRYLAAEESIRNFLDIGAGLPTESNTHQVAQQVAPDARVLYVDNDPMVLVHARALMRGTAPEGITGYLDADFHDPLRILDEAAKVLDFDRPIAVMFMGVLGFCPDYEVARQVVVDTMAGVPSGSFLVLWDCTDTSEEARLSTEKYAESGTLPYNLRTIDQVNGYFDGLEKVEPGVVSISAWRPEDEAAHVHGYGAVARKP
ncbi:SAM-dependent methyltransferase [Actinomadura meridiana]|uniref:SAM-dependent methyltransferase n=1 Tax=Actinomadura meridiana TaxID=559626 RepID=A0ABP8CNJ3_9ACTN